MANLAAAALDFRLKNIVTSTFSQNSLLCQVYFVSVAVKPCQLHGPIAFHTSVQCCVPWQRTTTVRVRFYRNEQTVEIQFGHYCIYAHLPRKKTSRHKRHDSQISILRSDRSHRYDFERTGSTESRLIEPRFPRTSLKFSSATFECFQLRNRDVLHTVCKETTRHTVDLRAPNLFSCAFLQATVCAHTPSLMVTYRCVGDDERPFAAGVQFVFFRTLGKHYCETACDFFLSFCLRCWLLPRETAVYLQSKISCSKVQVISASLQVTLSTLLDKNRRCLLDSKHPLHPLCGLV